MQERQIKLDVQFVLFDWFIQDGEQVERADKFVRHFSYPLSLYTITIILFVCWFNHGYHGQYNNHLVFKELQWMERWSDLATINRIQRFNLSDSQEDIAERPRVSTFISSMANYSNTIPAADDADAKPAAQSAGMGTLIGVFLPCIQNIFGVILFIRLTWVVGTAGAVCAFLLVLGCCCVVSCLRCIKTSRWVVMEKDKTTANERPKDKGGHRAMVLLIDHKPIVNLFLGSAI